MFIMLCFFMVIYIFYMYKDIIIFFYSDLIHQLLFFLIFIIIIIYFNTNFLNIEHVISNIKIIIDNYKTNFIFINTTMNQFYFYFGNRYIVFQNNNINYKLKYLNFITNLILSLRRINF